ncbi:MAG: MAPEG family protein [Proteobacteria bacterium]|nr:MAPEG family protein [Pseudomonadota bacterium]
MPVAITALYAGILAFIAIALAANVGWRRPGLGVPLGDGGNEVLFVANRRHMNFVEHVPLTLILIAIVELNGAPSPWVHSLGGALVVARIVHPFGIHAETLNHPARAIGALLTVGVTATAAVLAIMQHFHAFP